MFSFETGTILDVAIGLAVMYLVISLIGTTCNEFLATMIDLRARTLASSLKQILDDPQLHKDFYDSGVVAGINDSLKRHPSYISSRNFADAVLASLDPTVPAAGFAARKASRNPPEDPVVTAMFRGSRSTSYQRR